MLTITDRFAGDNYIVRATTVDPGGKPFNNDSGVKADTNADAETDPAAIKASGTLTAWKRVYFEEDWMYKFGSLLDASTAVGDSSVKVKDDTVFQVGQTVRIFDSERIEQDAWRIATIDRTTHILGLDNGAGQAVSLGGPYQISRQAYVGRETGNDGTDFFSVDTSHLAESFDDAYVEVQRGTNPIQHVPRFPIHSFNDQLNKPFEDNWFEHRGVRNYFYLVAADQDQDRQAKGVTSSAANISYIFTELQDATFNQETVHHEIGHQWSIGGEPNGGHDDEASHDNRDLCLMSLIRNTGDNILEFGIDHLYRLRDAVEPL